MTCFHQLESKNIFFAYIFTSFQFLENTIGRIFILAREKFTKALKAISSFNILHDIKTSFCHDKMFKIVLNAKIKKASE
jgi:hypothetical protein